MTKHLVLCVVGLLAQLPVSTFAQEVTVGVVMENYSVNEADGSIQVCAAVQSGVVSARSFQVGYLTRRFEGVSAPFAEAAAGDDYTTVSGIFTITDNNPQCIDIPIIQDSLPEETECFELLLFNLNNDPDLQENPNIAVICISDGTVGPTAVIIGFQFNLYTVAEDGGSARACVQVQNNQELDRSVLFSFFTVDGSATVASGDYSQISTTLSFNTANDRQLMCMDIPIIDDLLIEGSENFFVSLTTSEVGVTFNPSRTTVTISDNDTPSTDPCLAAPCDMNAVCARIGLTSSFTCTCLPGFIGNGFSCVVMGGGDDPHFSIALPSGELLCFTVQGEHGFAFNLVSNEKVKINALFVPDSVREEVTWMGSLGIVVNGEGYKGSNKTSLRFDAKTKQVVVGNKVTLDAYGIDSLAFRNGKLVISEKDQEKDHDYQHPSVCVNLEDLGLHFHVTFFGEHLDIYWNSVTGEQEGNTHGLIGQFFRNKVKIDRVRKILLLPNKDPVPVMRRPVWGFMERKVMDDQLCWTAMNPGYQGEGLIEGTPFDYLVNDVLEDSFVFQAKKL